MVTIMLKIKRVYDGESPAEGKRTLVDRLWPRGIKNRKFFSGFASTFRKNLTWSGLKPWAA
jgi:uncharacterized protein YeaO (DUF488 family)